MGTTIWITIGIMMGITMRIEGDWDCLDDAFSPAWEGINQIEQDIEEDTL